jgi:hypothetical protein
MQIYSQANKKLQNKAYLHWYEKFDVTYCDIKQAIEDTYDLAY